MSSIARPRRSIRGRSRHAVAGLTFVVAAAGAARAEEILGVRDDGALVTFDTADPSVIRSVHPVTGLAQNELLVGIDFRSTDGALFGVGSTSRVYHIQPETGFAVPLGTIPFTPLLTGADFGVAFEPSGTALRVTSDAGQNLVLDPSTGGVVSVDPALAFAAGEPNAGVAAAAAACAWTFSAQAGDVLYGLDVARGILVKIETPAFGSVRTIGPLGVPGLVAGGIAALDASPDTGIVYAILDPANNGTSRLYSIDLANGHATPLSVALPAALRAAAVVPASPPAPPGTKLVGLVQPSDLVSFTTDVPGLLLRTVHLRGLPPGETVLGIATRPANGILYALTRTALYDVNLQGGTAAIVGSGLGQTLPAGQYGCDFDPANDRLRAVSGTDVNVTVDPVTGVVVAADAAFAFADGDLHAGQAGLVRAVAFTGRATPGLPSKCFALETNAAVLARLGLTPPNEARDGRLSTIGPLSVEGLDTLPPGQSLTATGDRTAYAALQTSPAASSLFHVDLTSGRAVVVGGIATAGVVRGLTVQPTADPPRVFVGKLTVAFNLKKTGKDTLTLKGAAPFVVGSQAGKSVTIDVGGVRRTYLLNSKGRAKADGDSIHIGGVATRGIAMQLTLKKEDLAAAFADEQMDGTLPFYRAPRQLVVTLIADGKTYRVTVDLSYTSKPGNKGSAKTN